MGNTRSSTGGPRVATLLVALLLVPLLGSGWLAFRETRNARRDYVQAERLERASDELVRIGRLRAQLQHERNWTFSAHGMERIGIDDEWVYLLTSVDIDAELTRARQNVDAIMSDLDRPDVGHAIAVARQRSIDDQIILDTDDPFGLIRDPYAPVIADLERVSEEITDELMTAHVLRTDIRGQTLARLRQLEWALELFDLRTEQSNIFYQLMFADGDRGRLLLVLLEDDRRQAAALHQRLRRAVQEGGPMAVALDDLERSPAGARHLAEMEWITNTIAERVGGPTEAETVNAIEHLATMFEAGTIVSDDHLGLAELAADHMAFVSKELVSSTRQQSLQLLAAIAFSVAISLLGVGAVSRFIVRPLERLALAARGLRDGEFDFASDRGGPMEVREARRAIDEAAAQIDLVERQANALALGELEASVLAERAPGRLGRSVQQAVQTLTQSLNQREEFRQLLVHEAGHDALTQIPNRKATVERLRSALSRADRNGLSVAVLFIDLDGFKLINDQHGHAAGDEVLSRAAQRLSASVRAGDHVGRMGGDEFLIVSESVGRVEEVVDMANRIIEELSVPIPYNDTMLMISASIGVAYSGAMRAELDASPAGFDRRIEALLQEADLALYRAKGTGRSRVVVCDDDLRAVTAQQLGLDRAVRRALHHDEFVVHFQPTINPHTGDLVRFEALVRWQRRGEGLIPPDQFIPFCESSDLVIAVDQWVIRHVVLQIRRWIDDDATTIPVAVNVSGRHLNHAEFVRSVLDPLHEFGVDPSLLVVEVTEGALLEDPVEAANRFAELRRHGVRIAIDDFGTGYTSLGLLRTLPIDILKIDRSFTDDPSAEGLVRLIIEAGHLVGAIVTAEGVEDVAQANRMARLGSDELQGYYFGAPMPPGQIDLRQYQTRELQPADRL